jgi:electron transport complex protein RnfD
MVTEPEQKKLELASSPHIRDKDSVPRIMFGVAVALVPAVVASVYFFGLPALLTIVVCVISAMATEWVFCRARGRPSTLGDGSALVTGLLLALILPPNLNMQIVVVGAIIAVAFGKMVYGGLGSNIFNPALVGRAFLMACYPVALTTWVEPAGFPGLEAVTGATPLGMLKFEGQIAALENLFWGNVGGCLGETSSLAVLLGAAYLLYRKLITWHIPAAFLGTVAVFTGIMHLIDPAAYASPVFHVLAGGLLLGAFFMATDMVTSPTTLKGQVVFGIGAGLITVLIRLWGGYPEGVMYSILFMNAVTPLINRWTQPTIYGTRGGGEDK